MPFAEENGLSGSRVKLGLLGSLRWNSRRSPGLGCGPDHKLQVKEQEREYSRKVWRSPGPVPRSRSIKDLVKGSQRSWPK